MKRNPAALSFAMGTTLGGATMPMSEDEVAEKFRDCAAFARMPKERAEKTIELVLRLEDVHDIRELTAVLSAGT